MRRIALTIALTFTCLSASTAFGEDMRAKTFFNTYDSIYERFSGMSWASHIKNRRDQYRDQWLDSKYQNANVTPYITDEIKEAWADGYTGEGVTINIVDTFNERAAGGWGHTRGTTSHGGKVHAIIGGHEQYGQFQQGIAPDATINRINVTGNASWEQMTNADIVNWTTTYGLERNNFENPVFQIPKTDALLVISAGNYSSKCVEGDGRKNHCSRLALSAALGDNAENTLVVGAVYNYNDAIHVSSSKAGVTKDSFIVDDHNVEFHWDPIQVGSLNRDTRKVGGTSFAAARVTAKAALIKSKFPKFNGRDIARLIKATADDLGAPGVDPIYGHGKINLSRALSPVGSLR